MLRAMTVRFTDGSVEIVMFEKPPGALPLSVASYGACVLVAEQGGKVVDKVYNLRKIAGTQYERDVCARGAIQETWGALCNTQPLPFVAT